MKRRANVYLKGNTVVIMPSCRTTAGFYMEQEPVRTVQQGDVAAIGEAVLAALAAYRENIPTLRRKDHGPLSLAAIATGARTEAAFMRGAKTCAIEVDEQNCYVFSYENRGVQEGFVPQAAKELSFPCSSDAEMIGRMVLQGLAASTS